MAKELYRKYRPTTFEDVVGNETAIKSLKKELKNGSHVFLMTGPAGCGKTTLARIMAKEVGAGDLSIREINSAENRGIDTAREIMEQMSFMPTDGNASVWILDECHQMTPANQNAFLKPLEETPEHVYFFLCTTEPQKLIASLKTRCSVVNVKPLNDEEMKILLKRVVKSEDKKMGSEVYEKIIELANGGSRKALKLLAKVLYLDSNEERLESLKSEDVSEDKDAIELCRALLSKTNFNSCMKLVSTIDVSEPERVRMLVLSYMNSVLTKGFNEKAAAAMQAFGQNTTFNNGKFQITIALLDYFSLLSE